MKNEENKPLLGESISSKEETVEGEVESPCFLCGTTVNKNDDELGEVMPGGMSIFKTAVFIVAEIAGSGILALPNALAGTSWTGIGLLVVLGLLALYCATLLGDCWNIIKRKHDVPRNIRDPYPLIGIHAAGKFGKYAVELCIFFTLVGSSVVYILLSAKQISSILNVSIGEFDDPKTEFRFWILICGAVLIPCTWFASPKEMWFIAYGATVCTFAACVLIIIRSTMHLYNYGMADESKFTDPSVTSFFTAFGTIAFAYGGGSLLPTLQADMKKPTSFIYAAFLGFIFIFVLYLPCTLLPYLCIGSKIDPNVLETLETLPGDGKTMITIAKTLITFHLLFAIVVITNPITQLLEEKFGIEHKFGIKRILVRSINGVLMIGLAELFPNFGPILSLIGGSTLTCLCYIFPAMFYLQIEEKHLIPLHKKVLLIEIVFIALGCGAASTYSSILGFENPFKT
eukprot:TCONS_00062924-protein